jgi:RES domain
MTADHATLPDPPAARLRDVGIRDNEIHLIEQTHIWWRVHRTEGAFVLAWNEFRHYGPVLRFDPHPEPRREHPDHAVWCAAATPDAALAEAFQGTGTIDRNRQRPYLTGLSFTRPLRLLNLAVDSAGAWATRAGGTFAISTAPHALTQRWARAIVEAFPDLDGTMRR